MARGLIIVLAIVLGVTYLVCCAVTNVRGDAPLHWAVALGPAVGATFATAILTAPRRF